MQVIRCRADGAGQERSPHRIGDLSWPFTPCLLRSPRPGGGERIKLGHPLLDAYLDLVAARARWNTVVSTAFDLKVWVKV